ncbi:MAG TPA: helix-turn-helix transcriptional regulator [Bryobacteraceae bacterium]|nr:helix-turn-helix transcriptional regulator [Bryobacteraceae bacterium]
MTFLEAQQRLLAELRTHVRNGHLTEREMARLTGVSQPHIHNVLKGVRNLSPEIADRILKTFHLSVLDFSSPNELHDRITARLQRLLLVEMPMLLAPIGPNQPWRKEFSTRERFTLPVPMQRTRPHVAAVRLEPDPRMKMVLAQCDLAVLNVASQTARQTAGQTLLPLDPVGLYVVETTGGTAVRYLRTGSLGVYLATADALDFPEDWEVMGGASDIHARLLWIGNEKDRHLEVRQRGRVLATTS